MSLSHSQHSRQVLEQPTIASAGCGGVLIAEQPSIDYVILKDTNDTLVSKEDFSKPSEWQLILTYSVLKYGL